VGLFGFKFLIFQMLLKWEGECQTCVVTGSFDCWASSVVLNAENNFQYNLVLPSSQKVVFKFVVDGNWVVSDKYATECDAAGNYNNIANYEAKDQADQVVIDAPVAAEPQAVAPKSSIEAAVTDAMDKVASETVPAAKRMSIFPFVHEANTRSCHPHPNALLSISPDQLP
jgi:Glycogen recognition site of AMP-activated protein kinase